THLQALQLVQNEVWKPLASAYREELKNPPPPVPHPFKNPGYGLEVLTIDTGSCAPDAPGLSSAHSFSTDQHPAPNNDGLIPFYSTKGHLAPNKHRNQSSPSSPGWVSPRLPVFVQYGLLLFKGLMLSVCCVVLCRRRCQEEDSQSFRYSDKWLGGLDWLISGGLSYV
ncbi:hypothetical protein STEG23_025467, partial [Scotinomys teguina]